MGNCRQTADIVLCRHATSKSRPLPPPAPLAQASHSVSADLSGWWLDCEVDRGGAVLHFPQWSWTSAIATSQPEWRHQVTNHSNLMNKLIKIVLFNKNICIYIGLFFWILESYRLYVSILRILRNFMFLVWLIKFYKISPSLKTAKVMGFLSNWFPNKCQTK